MAAQDDRLCGEMSLDDDPKVELLAQEQKNGVWPARRVLDPEGRGISGNVETINLEEKAAA